MHYNTLAPELGSAYRTTKEHNDSYPMLKTKIPAFKELRGLGIRKSGVFFGVSSDTNSEDAIVYGSVKPEDYTTIWVRRSGCVLVQTSSDTKQGDIAYLKDDGKFTTDGTGLNPVGIFEEDGHETKDADGNVIKVGFLAFDAFSPVITEQTATNGGNSAFATLKADTTTPFIMKILKAILVKLNMTNEVKELEKFEKPNNEEEIINN